MQYGVYILFLICPLSRVSRTCMKAKKATICSCSSSESCSCCDRAAPGQSEKPQRPKPLYLPTLFPVGVGHGIKYSLDTGTTSPPESFTRQTPVLCLFFIATHSDKCAFQRIRRAWRSAWQEGRVKPLSPPLD